MTGSGPYYPPGGGAYEPPRRRFPWLPVIIGVVLIAVALIILLALAYPALFGVSPSPYRFGLFGGLFFFFFVLIIIFFIVRVAFWSTRASRYGRGYYRQYPPGGYGPNRPAMVARMRYARGEITREQYDQIMQDLSRRPGAP